MPDSREYTVTQTLQFIYASFILQGKLWKHRLKQNFIFSLVHQKRSLTPRGNTAMHNDTAFYSTKWEDWTAMEDSSQESFQGSQLPILDKGCSYGFSLIPLTGKQYKMKAHREKSLISLFLTNLLISLLPTPQLDVKRTIWKGLKV